MPTWHSSVVPSMITLTSLIMSWFIIASNKLITHFNTGINRTWTLAHYCRWLLLVSVHDLKPCQWEIDVYQPCYSLVVKYWMKRFWSCQNSLRNCDKLQVISNWLDLVSCWGLRVSRNTSRVLFHVEACESQEIQVEGFNNKVILLKWEWCLEGKGIDDRLLRHNRKVWSALRWLLSNIIYLVNNSRDAICSPGPLILIIR